MDGFAVYGTGTNHQYSLSVHVQKIASIAFVGPCPRPHHNCRTNEAFIVLRWLALEGPHNNEINQRL